MLTQIFLGFSSIKLPLYVLDAFPEVQLVGFNIILKRFPFPEFDAIFILGSPSESRTGVNSVQRRKKSWSQKTRPAVRQVHKAGSKLPGPKYLAWY
jgi:hypothetical protein